MVDEFCWNVLRSDCVDRLIDLLASEILTATLAQNTAFAALADEVVSSFGVVASCSVHRRGLLCLLLVSFISH